MINHLKTAQLLLKKVARIKHKHTSASKHMIIQAKNKFYLQFQFQLETNCAQTPIHCQNIVSKHHSKLQFRTILKHFPFS